MLSMSAMNQGRRDSGASYRLAKKEWGEKTAKNVSGTILFNREDLKEWMYLDSLENSERGIWVLLRKFLSFLPRAHLDHDQATDLIS